MKEIQGDAKNISSLLDRARFSIDYYQREYRWETKHVVKLVEDLTEKFLESHRDGNDRSEVQNYGRYFLGSIIISHKNGNRFIIDGQQRLTSITLLLIHLYRHLSDDGDKHNLSNLILSKKFGKKSFNLDVEERVACMTALYSGEAFDETNQPESVANLAARFSDIEESFSEDILKGKNLPYFADWLMENVYLVEITAYSDADAYTIFETMNDRGMSLTPTDMLKGYLLAKIDDIDMRNGASVLWRNRVESLRKLGKDEDADAIKTWLRSQHAKTIRERKPGAKPCDFDLIGTEFHRWVRDHEQDLSLTDGTSFCDFIHEDFSFYSRWYETILLAARDLTEGLEVIHYNAQNKFTLQYQLLMAPILRSDGDEEIRHKLRIVGSFVDILLTRRIWNWKATTHSAMQYAMQLMIRRIRGKSAEELAEILIKYLSNTNETFATNDRFCLHGTNGQRIHRLLARMTDYIETNSGRPSRYKEYIQRSGTRGYQVEHIWAFQPNRHKSEFQHMYDFMEYRDRIGGLLLLPKSFNASFGDMTYKSKVPHYYGQNLLAQSLCEKAYEKDPGFAKFVKKSGLPFRPHEEFKKADLDERQKLYGLIAERVWDPDTLRRELEK